MNVTETPQLGLVPATFDASGLARLRQSPIVGLSRISDGLMQGGADWCCSRFNMRSPQSIESAYRQLQQNFLRHGALLRNIPDTTFKLSPDQPTNRGFYFELPDPTLSPLVKLNFPLLSSGNSATDKRSLMPKVFQRFLERASSNSFFGNSSDIMRGTVGCMQGSYSRSTEACMVSVAMVAKPAAYGVMEQQLAFHALSEDAKLFSIAFATEKEKPLVSKLSQESVRGLAGIGRGLSVDVFNIPNDLSWLKKIVANRGMIVRGTLDSVKGIPSVYDDSSYWIASFADSLDATVEVRRSPFDSIRGQETSLHLSDFSDPRLFSLWSDILSELSRRGGVTKKGGAFNKFFDQHSEIMWLPPFPCANNSSANISTKGDLSELGKS